MELIIKVVSNLLRFLGSRWLKKNTVALLEKWFATDEIMQRHREQSYFYEVLESVSVIHVISAVIIRMFLKFHQTSNNAYTCKGPEKSRSNLILLVSEQGCVYLKIYQAFREWKWEEILLVDFGLRLIISQSLTLLKSFWTLRRSQFFYSPIGSYRVHILQVCS